MATAWLFPTARSGEPSDSHHVPGLFNRSLTPVLLSLAKRACVHPVYTIVSVGILASTTYLGLFESSLFDRRISANNAIGRIDINYLLAGSKNLYTAPDTNWKWSTEDSWNDTPIDDVSSNQRASYVSPPNTNCFFLAVCRSGDFGIPRFGSWFLQSRTSTTFG
jgi:hydroxymethylglutaryl-CoA reductase (NADPH)